MQDAIPCTFMRGGTSRGAYFRAEDLPADAAARDAALLAVMGSPDERQIDGMGGANPLTSKVAIVSKSVEPGVDVDYLFAQVFVDRPVVGYGQNCGNILAGVAQYAVEQGLVAAASPTTDVTIRMVNSGDLATATIVTPDGRVTYEGDAAIDGVPGTAAPVKLYFADTAGSLCDALLPTGNLSDEIDGVAVTCIDNGMPVVVLRAADFGVSGAETPAQLDADGNLKARVEAIRLKAGPLMNLGDVAEQTVPKMMLVAPPRDGGALSTRTFIPHRCHDAIGVFAAVTAATAALIPGTVAAGVAGPLPPQTTSMRIEHPTGGMDVEIELEDADGAPRVRRSGFLRTARKLCEGAVFVPRRPEGGT
jgi:4-oxalomesaconate tautomerase